MSSTLGLAIGESFAELSGYSADSLTPFYQARWYLPKKNLADALAAAVKAAPSPGGRLRVATDSVERILAREQGRAPAVLVTAGFETWLRLRQPIISPPFSLSSKRRELPIENDSIFGVTERVSHDGKILTALSREDLEFLAAKLELLKIKEIALLFLHATANPEHELAAAAYLRDKGFRVFSSHQVAASSLAERWRRTVESAFSESALSDEKTQLETALKDAGDWELELWTAAGPRPWSEHSAINVRGGLKRAIAQATPGGLHLHCGFDGIRVVSPATPLTERSVLLPTALVEHDVWPFPHLAFSGSGYEPGPMMFGKSNRLATLDILYVRDRLLEIEGFTTLASEKSRPRILESLFTLAKSPSASHKKRAPDAKEISADLERAIVEQIAILIAESSRPPGSSKDSREVALTGPLAATFAPLLRERRFDLKFDVRDAFFESQACALAKEKA